MHSSIKTCTEQIADIATTSLLQNLLVSPSLMAIHYSVRYPFLRFVLYSYVHSYLLRLLARSLDTNHYHSIIDTGKVPFP